MSFLRSGLDSKQLCQKALLNNDQFSEEAATTTISKEKSKSPRDIITSGSGSCGFSCETLHGLVDNETECSVETKNKHWSNRSTQILGSRKRRNYRFYLLHHKIMLFFFKVTHRLHSIFTSIRNKIHMRRKHLTFVIHRREEKHPGNEQWHQKGIVDHVKQKPLGKGSRICPSVGLVCGWVHFRCSGNTNGGDSNHNFLFLKCSGSGGFITNDDPISLDFMTLKREQK